MSKYSGIASVLSEDAARIKRDELFGIVKAHDAGNRLRREYWGPPSDVPTGKGPYKWQARFHNAGADFKERGMMAANRVGKTMSCAAEVAMHLTGQYPPWWHGARFKRAIECWVGSETNEASRDIVQLALLGRTPGTGWIPQKAIHPDGPSMRNCGIVGVADFVRVKHVTGDWSVCGFKTYEQGRKRWQGTGKDVLWFDEEPPEDIYTEGITRTVNTKGGQSGLVIVSWTPLLGDTEVVLYYDSGSPLVYSITVTWDDAPHLTEKEKAEMLLRYPEHERDARSKGIPMKGSGGVYNVNDDDIAYDFFRIPSHFRRIAGIDFGIDAKHPCAVIWLAHDPDSDIIYLYDLHLAANQTTVYHAEAIKRRGDWIPVAWPHDGMSRDKTSGVALKDSYVKHRVNMLPFSARYDDEKGGGQGTEPVVQDILERMRTGRFKVRRDLTAWFQAKRRYHRKDGVIVKKGDDPLAATHYADMMLRFAVADTSGIVLPATSGLESYDPLAGVIGR